MRLIDADALIENKFKNDISYNAFVSLVKRQPSAQPEIIRCHSCKHWTRTIGEMRGFGLGICDFHNAEYVTCNGFCHWAERREQDG